MPTLSICIPTYQRCDLVCRCVMSILEYPDDDIEIVVSDNGSTDDTFKKLSEINDSRLRIFRNTENMGVKYNFLRVLKESSGSFSLIISDEDKIIFSGLTELLAYLKMNPNVAAIGCSLVRLQDDGDIKSHREFNNQTLNPGFEAYYSSWYFGLISGIVFNRRFLDYDMNFGNILPQIDMLQYLSFKNVFYLMKEPVVEVHEFQKGTYADFSSLRYEGETYFEPTHQRKLFIEYVKRDLDCNFSDIQNISLCKKRLFFYVGSSVKFSSEYQDKIETLFTHDARDKGKLLKHYAELFENRDAFFKEITTDAVEFLCEINEGSFWPCVKNAISFMFSEKMFYNGGGALKENELAQLRSTIAGISKCIFFGGGKINAGLENNFSESECIKETFSDVLDEDLISYINNSPARFGTNSMSWHFYCFKRLIASKKYAEAVLAMENYVELYYKGFPLFMPCADFTHITSAHFHLGRLYLEMNEKPKAKHNLEKCVSLLADCAEPRHCAAENLLRKIDV